MTAWPSPYHSPAHGQSQAGLGGPHWPGPILISSLGVSAEKIFENWFILCAC